jgi:glycyl-tRNA synthetase
MSDEKNPEKNTDLMEKIESLCKRRGFIFQGSELYGGLAGTWDYGPLGVALKKNIERLWWHRFVESREDNYGLESAILMNPKVWEASGHVAGFSDPLVEDLKTKKRYRADHLLEEAGVDVHGMTLAQMSEAMKEKGIKSPEKNDLSEVRQFNMMFATQIGAVEDSSAKVYLRPENAQGMFVNYKNILDSIHPKLPFGIAQMGKAFRNEITPRDFTFRTREFNLMEFEYFVKPAEWEKYFEYWKYQMTEWIEQIGIDPFKVHQLEVAPEDRAHYSTRTTDFEFDFPFGRKELYGLACRTDFDLKRHQESSGVSLEYLDEEAAVDSPDRKFLPYAIEPTFGLDRTILAVLTSAYKEDISKPDEVRSYLAFKPSVAPVICAVSPLLKNKPELVAMARRVYDILKTEFGRVMWDDNGNIGKRYRRQDEIGTPWCIVIDFDSLTNDDVTVRDRDNATQERVSMQDLVSKIKSQLS